MTTLTPFNLTPLGLFHTLVSIVCVALALMALWRDKGISPRSPLGRAYLVSLWITTLSGFPIFRRGSAGPPHAIGVLIVLALVAAALAARTRWFGRASAYVEAVSYSVTVLFLMIATVTETLTRVPPSAPWVSSPESPILLPFQGTLVLLFLVGVFLQVRRLRAASSR